MFENEKEISLWNQKKIINFLDLIILGSMKRDDEMGDKNSIISNNLMELREMIMNLNKAEIRG